MLFNVVYYTTYKKQENMNYHFTFAVKWSIYYVTIITMGIFSQVKIWHVTYVFSYVKISHFTWKLTFFSCGVYIRNVHNIYWFQVYKMSFSIFMMKILDSELSFWKRERNLGLTGYWLQLNLLLRPPLS